MKVWELRERAEKIRRHLLQYRLATEEEIERYWPAEPEWPLEGVTPANYLREHPEGEHAGTAVQLLDTADVLPLFRDPDFPPDEALRRLSAVHERLRRWSTAVMQMSRMFGREEWMREGSDYASEQLLKALRDEPEEVQLTTGEKVSVYPKSFDVLRWASVRGLLMEWVEARRVALERAVGEDTVEREAVPEPISVVEAAYQEISDQTAVLCWVATSPGVGFPWEPNPSDPWIPTEDPPRRFYELHPLDVRFICEGFRRVNFMRLHWLPQLQGKKKDGPSGWDVFWANRAKRTKKPARYLMMRESFAAQLAEETLAAHSLEEVLAGD